MSWIGSSSPTASLVAAALKPSGRRDVVQLQQARVVVVVEAEHVDESAGQAAEPGQPLGLPRVEPVPHRGRDEVAQDIFVVDGRSGNRAPRGRRRQADQADALLLARHEVTRALEQRGGLGAEQDVPRLGVALGVEGLAGAGPLSPLQQAFLDNMAVQCGFCTPGILMTLTALLERRPSPSRQEVETALAGNLCRCTGYRQVVDAALAAAREAGK